MLSNADDDDDKESTTAGGAMSVVGVRGGGREHGWWSPQCTGAPQRCDGQRRREAWIAHELARRDARRDGDCRVQRGGRRDARPIGAVRTANASQQEAAVWRASMRSRTSGSAMMKQRAEGTQRMLASEGRRMADKWRAHAALARGTMTMRSATARCEWRAARCRPVGCAISTKSPRRDGAIPVQLLNMSTKCSRCAGNEMCDKIAVTHGRESLRMVAHRSTRGRSFGNARPMRHA
ncbi:hypothetical protein Scep_025960 [Stephania cephalantha]|uniref:Uncharacterized protein n=1 Tax=Stephania cephalantha TaxID=152367 RepID=A0AAP0EJ78_9MAGN